MKTGLLFKASIILACGFAMTGSVVRAEQPKRLNVLFIAIDDLRPTLGCYGDKIALTPGIDRLASDGITFNRAYCQLAVCCPSRLSLITGLRPDTIRVWDLKTHFRDAVPDAVTLPQLFKNNGYHTQSIGKILHGNGKPSQDPPSWSAKPLYDVVGDANVRYVLPENRRDKKRKGASAEIADAPDSVYIDGMVCDAAIATLAELQENEQPFFLAVGFRKPHLPFSAPKKYWDLYDREQIPLPTTVDYPQDAPEFAIQSWMELEGYTDIPDDADLSVDKVRELRHGYYACVSFVDALVERLLGQLKKLELDGNTVVVLWGDHGFHLGEQGLWTKSNNFELATRAPLIMSVPKEATGGGTSNALVEFVDVYPTVADVCGLQPPAGGEGISLRPLLNEPDRPWKRAAFSQFPRAYESNRHQGHGDVMGYAVRTRRYRYVEWQEWDSKQVVQRELYDHDVDPYESRNLAGQSQYAAATEELAKVLAEGWKSVLPSSTEAKR